MSVQLEVLTEAGFRCAVPTCRTILALNLHHITYVSEDGGNELSNLLALCANCHLLHHNKIIPQEAIRVWKGMLISLSQAFDKDAIDTLLFLDKVANSKLDPPIISGDVLMRYSSLIASGLATYYRYGHPVLTVGPDSKVTSSEYRYEGYTVSITRKGKLLIDAWKQGNMDALKHALEPNSIA